jgi:hypothetical protein
MHVSMRLIAVIGAVQLLSIVVGWSLLGIVLKYSAYPSETFVRCYPTTVWLRESGHWLLLVSAVWTITATIVAHTGDRMLANAVLMVLGIVFAVGTLGLFLIAAADPYRRELITGVPAEARPLPSSPGSSGR